MNNSTDIIFLIIVIIFALSIAFVLLREVLTWYWKINEISANQRKTNELLNEQNELLRNNNDILKEFVDDFSNK